MFKKIYNLPYHDIVIFETYNNLHELEYLAYVYGEMNQNEIEILWTQHKKGEMNLILEYTNIKRHSAELLQHHEIIIKLIHSRFESKINKN